jgi:hypothetical protein
MKTLTAYPSEQELLGYFRIFATPPGGFLREITVFRGAPVKIGGVSTQDPFGERTAQLSFPQITVFDTPGEGDVDWLVPDCNVDIVWQNVGGYDFDWRWEGYIASYNFSLSGQDSNFSTDLKGCFYGLDDYLAIPSFPKRPIPYEVLIAQAFDQDEHFASLGRFRVLFPSDWTKVVPPFGDPNYLSALKPWGVKTGQRWTGITTRSTGSWEPLLTGHVQTKLAVMFDEGGRQWSIRNRGYRRPELFLRRIPEATDDRIIEIQLGAPGVTMDGVRDFTQRAGVIYGQGVDEEGISYSTIQVSPDGRDTHFAPFAYNPRMYPRKHNPRLDSTLKPKESRLSFVDGVDELSAMMIAQAQYQRFAEPGITGTITLTTDPRTSAGVLVPRLMIRGGQTIRINGLFGIKEGVLAHLTEVTADFDSLKTSLTFDTKYRDQLTVSEVQARTRDALTPVHALQVGKFSNTIQDLVLPWSYKAGSGIIPTPAKEFFNEKITDPNAAFPFEAWTRKYPPKNPAYRPYYIEIGKTNQDNSSANWSCVSRDGQPLMAIPIRMSQAGTIRLSQLAAYDRDGNVLPVKFHLSVYDTNGIAVDGMPQFPGKPGDTDFPEYLHARRVDGTVITTHYGTGIMGNNGPAKLQTHPFYKGGWEKVQPNGMKFPWGGTTGEPQLPDVDPKVGWGTFYEPAGYSPGRFSKGAARTGMLSDDATWGWDLTDISVRTDSKALNLRDEYAGQLFVMIYCDDQDDQSVFFMGRFIRQEPGQS